MKILKRLIPFIKPVHHFLPEYIVYTVLGILFGLMNFTLLIPLLNLLFAKDAPAIPASLPAFTVSIEYFKSAFNYYFAHIRNKQGAFATLVYVCSIIAVAVVMSNIFRYLAIKVLLRLRLKVMAGIRNALYEKYLKQSLSYHHNNNKGGLISIMTGEVQEIESSVINALQIILRDPFVVIVYFSMLFYWDYKLTLFTLIFLPITGIVISRTTRKLKKLSYFSPEIMGSFLTITDESISGIRQIQSFTSENFMVRKFKLLNEAFNKHSKALFSKKEIASPISEVLGVTAALMLIIFGGYLILNGKSNLSGERFITYLVLYTQIIQPLKNISQTSINLQRGVVACERIFSIIDAPVIIKDESNAIDKKEFNNEINIENITFSYGHTTVINEVNINVKKGQVIALVGQSGGGKSTLVDLLSRFYDVERGGISIDGTDIKDIKLQDLRGMIGTVSQDTFLFNDTVSSNIALGRPDATEEEIIAAAKIANAHEFILNMPQGYKTIVGERGVKLSGGQRQRITIARAMLKNPPILILDEATSALDTESERLVQDAINRIMENRTSIVIAHRLSTVRHANEIVVLERGQVVERGTHVELLERNGTYRKLIDLQEVK